jgi:branched-chain amino acid transport system substrate-binding protein
VPYETSAPTIDSQIVQLKSSGADIFLNIATPKFAAQAIRKVAELGWKPVHFLNNVSVSVGAVLSPAGLENGKDILSTGYIKEPSDPAWKDDEGMKKWTAFMDKYNADADKASSFTSYGYSVAQLIVQVLQQCGNELTRENVMKQAASVKDFKPDLLIPGIAVNTGPQDFFPIEQLQMMKFDGKSWQFFGPIIDGNLGSG